MLEVVEALERIGTTKGIARPQKVKAAFSQEYLRFDTEIGDKTSFAQALQGLREYANKEASVARITSIDVEFNQWLLSFALPMADPWWQVNPRLSGSGHPQSSWQPEQVGAWMRALANALTASPDKPEVSGEPREARAAMEIQIAASRRMEDVAHRIAEELGKVAIERDRAL